MTSADLKKSILQQAVQGKLVPQSPDDESVSVLLDRIRAEKARLIDEGKIKRDKNESIIYRTTDGQYIERIGKTETDITNQIPFEIPESWAWSKIGNIFFHNNGKQLNKSNKSGVMMNYITTSNLYWDGFRLGNLKQMPFETSEIERCQAVKGDLLVCEGGDIGRSCIWEYDYPIMFQNHIHRLRGIINVTTKYFYYIFYLYNLMGIIGGKGIGIQGFSSKALHNTFVPLPPLAEQERIVAKIEELMPMVEEYGRAQTRLDDLYSSLDDNLRKSILQYAIQGKLVPQIPDEEPAYALLDRIRAEKARLVAEGKIKRDKNESVIYRNPDGQYIERIGKTETDITDQIPFEIPDSWEWVRMGQIGDWGAGATPAKSESKYYGGDILWLRTGELNNATVYDTDIKITDKALKECSLRLNKIGDILIAMYGATIGKLAIVGTPLTTNQACCACTPILVYNLYLFYFLMASKPDFVKKGEGGAQPNISREKLINYLMPLPPLAEQKRIVERIEQIFSLCK